MLIRRSRTLVCQNGSPFSFYDDQQDSMRALISFLQDVEAGNFVPDRRTNNLYARSVVFVKDAERSLSFYTETVACGRVWTGTCELVAAVDATLQPLRESSTRGR